MDVTVDLLVAGWLFGSPTGLLLATLMIINDEQRRVLLLILELSCAQCRVM